MALAVKSEGGAVRVVWPEKSGVEMVLTASEAAELGRALLAASGEKRVPQSRQIGGIIGPY